MENGFDLHFNQFESPPPKDHLCQVWLKLAQWFWRRFLNCLNIILVFLYYLPWEKGVALHLNKLESPPPKDALCQVWLKLAQCFWRRFLNIFFYIILLFRYYLPLEKGRGPSFEQTWIPSTQGCFVPTLVEIGPVVLEKKSKMWKNYRQMDRKQVIRQAYLSFQLRWAKNEKCVLFRSLF